MKVLPIDIRQKSFHKKTFGGFDPTEVQSFLMGLSEEWLLVTSKNKDLEERLRASQQELDRLHQMEGALLDALSKAESRKKEIIDQSKKEAKIRVMEGEIAAEALMSTAKQRAEQMLHNVQVECEMQLKSMQQDFEVLNQSYQEVEAHTSKLIAEMQQFVDDANNKIAHLSTIKQKTMISDKLDTAKKLLETASDLTTQVGKMSKRKIDIAVSEMDTQDVLNPMAELQDMILADSDGDTSSSTEKAEPTNHQRTTLQMLQEKAKKSSSGGKYRKVV